ncbi:hypothetical protein EYZ11_012075 [Aspergillus tanneri]|uniref:Nudix hydrolase domain-containing protein n=1 Tax=Aspergillus tanneri TaxID=1220188 RepID=A0A4S3J157_9EURO|nr:hypothetical protein EYZ11_012075 [Aspergillus tanneri]
MLPPEAILEAFIPGYGPFAHFVSLFFQIDISSYIIVLAASMCFWTFAAPALWDRFQRFFLIFASSAEIRYHDDLYNDIMRWISMQRDLSQTQRFVASTRVNFVSLWDEDNGEKDLSEEDQLRFENDPRDFWTKRKYLDKLRTIRCTPAPLDMHYLTYKGCWIVFCRRPYKDVGSPWLANMERLYFYAAPWRKHVLKGLLDDIQRASIEHDSDHIVIKRALKLKGDFQWTRVSSKKPRPLSTIVIDPEWKKSFSKDVQDYLHPRTRHWYQSRGLPCRRGYLFYGAPGTGKSSLCFGIASLVQLDIFMVSLSANGLDENSLALLFQTLPPRCIVLFEDVDQAGIPNRGTDNLPQMHDETVSDENSIVESHHERPSGVTLSAFLNIIDGVSAQEGRILIMTTNHIERLDEALLRPGRVDMKVPFNHADRLAIQEHFLAFYLKPTDTLVMGTPTPDGSIRPLSTPVYSEWALKDIVDLAVSFANQVPPDQYTAAAIQNYLLQYRNDPVSAVRNVTGWLFDLNCETDLSAFRIAESPHQFKFHGTIYSVRVSGYIFSWQDEDNNEAVDSEKPRLLLLQRASCDTNPGYWEVAGGGVEKQDQKPRTALEREVREETGLQLSRVTHPLPIRIWTQLKEGKWHKYVGLPYIIEVEASKPRTNSQQHQAFAWVTEAEVLDGKYQMFGNHKETILKAFAVIKRGSV